MVKRYVVGCDIKGEFLNIFKDKRTYVRKGNAEKVAWEFNFHCTSPYVVEVREIDFETDAETIARQAARIKELEGEIGKLKKFRTEAVGLA